MVGSAFARPLSASPVERIASRAIRLPDSALTLTFLRLLLT